MSNLNIKSGDAYARLIINSMIETENETPENERTPEKLLNLWFEEIEIFADQKWMSYILGDEDTYKFTPDEMMGLYDKANERFTSITLNSLVDKDLIEAGINNKGEMIYRITEQGKEAVKNS